MRFNLILFVLVLANQNFIEDEDDDEDEVCNRVWKFTKMTLDLMFHIRLRVQVKFEPLIRRF
jgi:hypothetical protein